MEYRTEIARRWQAFSESFDQSLEPIADIYNNLGELMVPVFGWEVTTAVFEAIYSNASISIPSETDASAITIASCLPLPELKKTPTYRWIALVHLYAYWGLESAPDGSFRWVRDVVSDVMSFRENGNTGFLQILTCGNDALTNALRAANARLVIDSTEGASVTPAELAALAQIDIKTLRNSLTPSGRRKSGLNVDSEGNVSRDSAKTWLLSRPEFLPTISTTESTQILRRADTIGKETDIVFVPMAEDGSAFTPNVCRDGKYYVETPDGEAAFDSYCEALKVITVMAVPSWRRPTAEGRWGVVRGNAWRRATMTELGIKKEGRK